MLSLKKINVTVYISDLQKGPFTSDDIENIRKNMANSTIAANNPALKSWVNVPAGSDFPIQNLPFGIFHLKNEEILSIFDNIKDKFKFLVITSCLNNINTDNFNKCYYSSKNINIKPFNKSYNFQIKIYEKSENRNVYIYTHNSFYNI